MLDRLLPLPLSVVWCFSPGLASHETRSQWNLGSLARKSWISNHCEVGWWKTCHFSARESSSMIHFRLDWSLQWNSLACLKIFGSPKYRNIMQYINGDYINDSKLATHQWWTFMQCHGNTHITWKLLSPAMETPALCRFLSPACHHGKRLPPSPWAVFQPETACDPGKPNVRKMTDCSSRCYQYFSNPTKGWKVSISIYPILPIPLS